MVIMLFVLGDHGWKMKFGCGVGLDYALVWFLLKGVDYGNSFKWMKEVILFIYVSKWDYGSV